MSREDRDLNSAEASAAAALHQALHDRAAAHPLPTTVVADALGSMAMSGTGSPRAASLRPARSLLALAAAGLVGFLALGGFVLTHTGPGKTPLPVTSGPIPTASVSEPLGLGPFEPSLDVAEPQIKAGSAAMHEDFGSAADGVLFVKDYGSSPSGNNVYRLTLYRSFDGLDWQTRTVPVPADQQDSVAACRGWNCVVVSNFPQNGSMLATTDGQQWDKVPSAPALFQVYLTAGPTGFVMSGNELKTFGSRVLFSSDGRQWQDIQFAPGSQRAVGGVHADPAAGWFMVGGYGQAPNLKTAFEVSSDGLTWHQIADPGHLYTTDFLSGQSVFHFGGRWYVLANYRQMPEGYSAGGFGRPASSATPIASWTTLYWIDDGSSELKSSGKLSGTFPSEVVAMNGYLVGAKANRDFTATLMISTNVTDWTDRGLLPPGVPVPGSLHGIPVYYLPKLARAGSNVVMVGPALKPDEMGSGLYTAKAPG